MSVTQHPYLLIPLQSIGLFIALYLIISHVWMLLKPQESQAWLQSAHRNERAGMIAMGIGLAWFWLIVGPEKSGLLGALSMDLGDSPGGFNGLKPLLRLLVPLIFIGLVIWVKEFLFVRGLGFIFLMAAAPILGAAFQKDPTSRLLVVVFAYALVFKGLFFVGMPYLFRDGIKWASQSQERWRACALSGLLYGVAILACALFVW